MCIGTDSMEAAKGLIPHRLNRCELVGYRASLRGILLSSKESPPRGISILLLSEGAASFLTQDFKRNLAALP